MCAAQRVRHMCVRGFHLLCDSLVRLLRAFSNQLAIPDGLVPLSIRILLLVNHGARLTYIAQCC